MKIIKEFKIWYHGTNKENSELILKNGFKKGTYFANHLEDAIGFGGKYVFEVALLMDKKNYWEWITPIIISKNKIIRLKIYNDIKKIELNEELGKEVFEFNLKKDKEFFKKIYNVKDKEDLK